MIPRYTRPEMSAIWSEEARYRLFLEIETAALEAMEQEGSALPGGVAALREKGGFSIPRIDELEKTLKHDVLAFLTSVAEHAGPAVRSMHRGMTSSDLLDTATAAQLTRSADLILSELAEVRSVLKQRAREFQDTVCIGRSHGIHAEPTTFGLKLAGWFAEFGRAEQQIRAAREEIRAGTISGPVGTYASVSLAVEKAVLDKLGLIPEPVPTQVVARDRHAAFIQALARLGSSIERCCVEIRHLQRTEVREVEEPFTSGQKGSSAMPHKRNPILSENLTGLARLLRSHAQAALEDIALWHERDISHSSVERIILPDACTLAHFMLYRFKGMVQNLVVYPERMNANLELTRGVIFSGNVMLALTDTGLTREEAYALVQRHALAAIDGGATFTERISGDPQVTAKLSPEKLKNCFDLKHQLRNVGALFERVGI